MYMKIVLQVDDDTRTHPSHNSCTIVPVDSALTRVAYTRDIGLTAEKNWMDKRLGLVEIGEKEDGGGDEPEEDGEVVGSERV
jgi:hypothetical protein